MSLPAADPTSADVVVGGGRGVPSLAAARSRWPAERVRAALGFASLGGYLVISVLLAAEAARHGSFMADHVRGHPNHTFGTLATHALPGWTAARFVIALLALCVAYAGALAWGRDVPVRWALGAVAAIVVVFTVAPPLLSTDVFSYVGYGRLGVLHHVNPYVHGPAAAPGDPVYPWIGATWLRTPSAYGPLFTLLTYPLALVGVGPAVWLLKLLEGLAAAGLLALVWRLAGRLARPQLGAVLFVALNPLFSVYSLGGGHNDILMLALMLLGAAWALGGRTAAGAAGVVAAAAVKLTAGVALPFLWVAARPRRRVVLGAVLAVGVVVAVAVAVFGTDAIDFLGVLSREQRRLTSTESTPNELGALFGVGAHTPLRLAMDAVLGAGALGLLWATHRRRLSLLDAVGWVLVLVTLTTTWVQAWYVCWPLPFAALSSDRRLRVATLAVQAFFLAHRLPLLLA